MTTIVIDEKSKTGKLILIMIRETNCGKIIEEKEPDNLDHLIRQTEFDIRSGRIKKIIFVDLWK